ncbi:MAG: tetratricopeptide repeat protein [Myxococcota bacterium]|nr:tetratricopeptide repeat protein [Myxococcota bacterium]
MWTRAWRIGWSRLLALAESVWRDSLSLCLARLDDYRRRAAWENGLTYAEASLARFPGSAIVHFVAGQCAAQLGLTGYAVHRYAYAAALAPSDLRFTLHLGLAFIRQGRLQEAGTALQRTLDQAPNHHEAVYYMALILRETGHHEQAIDQLNAYLSTQPDDRSMRRLSMVCALECGRYAEAQSWAEAAIRQDQQDGALWEILARAEHRLERSHEAIQAISRAIELQPELGRRHRLLGRLLGAEHPTKARLHYRNAILATVPDRHAHRDLAELYLQLGDPMRARQELSLFRAYCPTGEHVGLHRRIEKAIGQRHGATQ